MPAALIRAELAAQWCKISGILYCLGPFFVLGHETLSTSFIPRRTCASVFFCAALSSFSANCLPCNFSIFQPGLTFELLSSRYTVNGALICEYWEGKEHMLAFTFEIFRMYVWPPPCCLLILCFSPDSTPGVSIRVSLRHDTRAKSI